MPKVKGEEEDQVKQIIQMRFIGEMKGIGELFEDLQLMTVKYSIEFVNNSNLKAKHLTQCLTMV